MGHTIRFEQKTSSFYIWMVGPSQVDTFDPKPLLDKHNGKDPGALFKVEPTQFNNNGNLPCESLEIQTARRLWHSRK